MSVTEIKIPRFSMFNEEYEIFLNLNEFLHLSEKLYRGKCITTPVSVLKDLGNVAKLPYVYIQNLFMALKDAAFSYHPSSTDIGKERHLRLFTEELLTNWAKQKTLLKKLIKQHFEPVLRVRECQKHWWQCRSQVNQYASMLDAAQTSLLYNTADENEYKARLMAVKGLKKDIASKQRKLAKAIREYAKAVELESSIRTEIIEVADCLKHGLTSRIKKKIEEALHLLGLVSRPSFGADIDVDSITNSILDLTSRTYRFEKPPVYLSTTFISTPTTEESPFDPPEGECVTYANYNYIGKITEACIGPSEDHLKLNRGDTVKLKMISRGGRTGFGWTKPSRFSAKKWGFFSIMNVSFTDDNI